ncbi:MAG: hypothetical protein ACYCPR_10430 [Thermoplasmataceae archaeon]|jgi:hypothetical protein
MKCGGIYSIEQCKCLLDKAEVKYNDYHNSPNGILRYLTWADPELKDIGITHGLKFLESKRIGLEDLGLDLAETYFIENPNELEKYEKSHSELTLDGVISIYSKLKLTKKLETFAGNSNKNLARIALQRLNDITPEKYYRKYYLVKNSEVLNCEFYLGESAVILKKFEIKDREIKNESTEKIQWSDIVCARKIRVKGLMFGILIELEENSGQWMAVIPMFNSNLTYISGDQENSDKGILELLENVETYSQRNDGGMLAATSDTLFSILKSVVVTDAKINSRNGEGVEHIIETFDSEYNANIVSID